MLWASLSPSPNERYFAHLPRRRGPANAVGISGGFDIWHTLTKPDAPVAVAALGGGTLLLRMDGTYPVFGTHVGGLLAVPLFGDRLRPYVALKANPVINGFLAVNLGATAGLSVRIADTVTVGAEAWKGAGWTIGFGDVRRPTLFSTVAAGYVGIDF